MKKKTISRSLNSMIHILLMYTQFEDSSFRSFRENCETNLHRKDPPPPRPPAPPPPPQKKNRNKCLKILTFLHLF